MVTAALVDRNIEAGEKLLAALDQAGIRVDVALWLYDLDSESWRLVLASPQLSAAGPLEAYGAVQSVVRSMDGLGIELSDISIRSMSSPLIQALSSVSHGQHLEGRRLAHNVIGGVYLEDAYFYRVRPQPDNRLYSRRLNAEG